MSSHKDIRIWRVSKDSTAGVEIGPTHALMAANRNNFFVATEIGLGLAGNSVSFMLPSEKIRHGGFFIRQNDFLQMIPSTIVTPNPNQIPFPPFGLVSSIIKDMPAFLGLLA